MDSLIQSSFLLNNRFLRFFTAACYSYQQNKFDDTIINVAILKGVLSIFFIVFAN